MTPRSVLRPLALSAAFCAVLPSVAAFAQEATTDAAQSPAVGEPFVAATHRDWEVLCSQIDEAGTLSCEMWQLLLDESDQPVAEISIAALPFGSEFTAGATVTTPLETFLPFGMGWRIGEAEEMRIEAFRVCTVVGCMVRMGIPAEEIEAMRAGSTATIMIAPFRAVDQPLGITVSLSGFTAALEDLQTRLSESAAAAREN